jgi:hypothetical protein
VTGSFLTKIDGELADTSDPYSGTGESNESNMSGERIRPDRVLAVITRHSPTVGILYGPPHSRRDPRALWCRGGLAALGGQAAEPVISVRLGEVQAEPPVA